MRERDGKDCCPYFLPQKDNTVRFEWTSAETQLEETGEILIKRAVDVVNTPVVCRVSNPISFAISDPVIQNCFTPSKYHVLSPVHFYFTHLQIKYISTPVVLFWSWSKWRLDSCGYISYLIWNEEQLNFTQWTNFLSISSPTLTCQIQFAVILHHQIFVFVLW